MIAPKLRFKEFEEKIIPSIFGKYIESSKYGPRFDAKDYSEQGNVRTIRGTDVSLEGAIKYSQVPLAKLPTKIVEEHQLLDGDILMITTADCGLSAVFYQQDIPYIASAYAVRIKLSNQNNSEWFKFYLQTKHIQNEVNKYVRKGTLSNLPLSDISKFLVNIPQIEEQTQIASFLSAVDEKISQLNQKHRLLCDYKQGMMQKLFSQQIRFKADDGSEFGEWENLKFKDVITIKYGKDHKKLDAGDIPVLGTGGIMRYVDSYLYDGESILIGRKGTIDKPQFISGKFWTVDTLFYTEIGEKILPNFAFHQLLLVNWLNLNEATGVPSLNTTSIGNIDLKVPCLEEQTKIANFLSAIDQKIEVVAEQIEQAKTWKKGLLQQMFV
jgi:type I restriction enzyme S subunit